MWEIILAAGWPIWPLIIASIIAVAIIVERLWALRAELIAPSNLLPEVQRWLGQGGVNKETLIKLQQHSLLGQIFASALANVDSSREVMKEAIEESGRAVAHKLEKYLTTLGTIATVSPLLGLLGTVIGMVELFGAFTATGHDVAQFARGISVALYNTAGGIVVAVPAMIFYRYFRGKVDGLIVEMEQQAVKLVELIHGERK
ncbi:MULTISPECIES: MotA/TolQ/ExbB proton channel family protein [Methylovorus]|uniref:MotA/TolQ/ExbB proton channel n=1 Tax=Methylovorus glucosotrophus (strain SIP3-4) TaxID=582744 RepID=C6X9R5_METGS|nr:MULTISPECIES: MotA/TolQ/ExbB proton channel family protein [Methylovorus]ACT49885.1 MotA/TolQ/ExbB proton channel [Methylovorus glucosotrophus SIP3-4]ADQ83845.1 MotA/TolQ/ExbB proton channel [Methylovorus sp. MP688]KAF0836495.1 biopolymer transport protein ExbB [Methylovorus glucosotrophus]